MQRVDQFGWLGKVMAVIDDLHLVELLQLHVVAFGVEDKNAVVGLDPSLCHQADEVAFSRRGGSSNQNPALASRYAGRGCVIECSDVDPPTRWAPTLCPVDTDLSSSATPEPSVRQGRYRHFAELTHGIGHSCTDLGDTE